MEIEKIKEDMEVIRQYAGDRTVITIKDNYYRCECEFQECFVNFLVHYGKADQPFGIEIRPKNSEDASDIVKTLIYNKD